MKPVALLIEDDPGMTTIYARNLERLGLDIRSAETLRDGILKCAEIPPPIMIFLDLRLADSTDKETLDGIATLQKYAPEAIIMVISGFITPEISELAFLKGAHAVQRKENITHSRDLWSLITSCISRAPSGTQKQLAFLQNLIESLTTAIKS